MVPISPGRRERHWKPLCACGEAAARLCQQRAAVYGTRVWSLGEEKMFCYQFGLICHLELIKSKLIFISN